MIRWSATRFTRLGPPSLGVASVLLLLYCSLEETWIGLPFLGAMLAITAYLLQEFQAGPVRIRFSANQWVEAEDGSHHIEIHQWAYGVRHPVAVVYRYFPDKGFFARIYAEAKELPNGNLRIEGGNDGAFDGEIRISR